VKGKSNFPNAMTGKSSLPKTAPKELVFSFRDFDHTQGQTFNEWERLSLLSVMLDKLKEYSRKSVNDAQKAGFKIYGEFPPNSLFKHPKYITEDAVWVSMHIQGKECIAGHLVENVFYIVFLDRHHKFWISEKKHT
jgi:hypothetical protein